MTDFDCTRFARWLDDGGANGVEPQVDARAQLHATACASCGERWAAERAIVVLFDEHTASPSTPSDFADRVMARVALTAQEAPARTIAAASLPAPVRVPGEVFPWWIRAAAQPASVLALMLAGLAIAFTPQLLGASRDAPQWSAAALAFFAGALAPTLGRVSAMAGSDPLTGAGVTLALLPLVVLVSIGLYRFGSTITTAHFATPVAAPARGRRA